MSTDIEDDSQIKHWGHTGGRIPPYPVRVSYNGVIKHVEGGKGKDVLFRAVQAFWLDDPRIKWHHEHMILCYEDGRWIEDTDTVAGSLVFMRPRSI